MSFTIDLLIKFLHRFVLILQVTSFVVVKTLIIVLRDWLFESLWLAGPI